MPRLGCCTAGELRNRKSAVTDVARISPTLGTSVIHKSPTAGPDRDSVTVA